MSIIFTKTVGNNNAGGLYLMARDLTTVKHEVNNLDSSVVVQ